MKYVFCNNPFQYRNSNGELVRATYSVDGIYNGVFGVLSWHYTLESAEKELAAMLEHNAIYGGFSGLVIRMTD